MDYAGLHQIINQAWSEDILPTLGEYISIPVQSPAFDPEWETNGHMDAAVDLLASWARLQLIGIKGALVEVLKLPGKTPAIFIDIPGTEASPVLIYGHLDKQPPMDGWTNGREAWRPTIEGDRLYGRGGADDGYALFSAITAVKAVRQAGQPHPRCLILIEACEESGSHDLDDHLATILPRVDTLAMIVALDGGAADYDRFWVTTSVRGQVAGILTVRTLREAIHSGDGAGVVPDAFRIARNLLDRFENATTGEIDSRFHTAIPAVRREQADACGNLIGASLFDALPIEQGVTFLNREPYELVLNRAWRPQLTVTAFEGLPDLAHASAVMHPQVRLRLGLRLPPTLEVNAVGAALKALLEDSPPFGAHVHFDVDMTSQGWEAPELEPALAEGLNRASLEVFGQPVGYFGGGGGIPFLASLSERFPEAAFLVTGVLGPESNAHGPNEFLHLPTARRITAVLAHLLIDLS